MHELEITSSQIARLVLGDEILLRVGKVGGNSTSIVFSRLFKSGEMRSGSRGIFKVVPTFKGT